MTRIESRPSRRGNWDYVFFIDICGHREDAAVAKALAHLRREATLFKVLGSYPVALGGGEEVSGHGEVVRDRRRHQDAVGRVRGLPCHDAETVAVPIDAPDLLAVGLEGLDDRDLVVLVVAQAAELVGDLALELVDLVGLDDPLGLAPLESEVVEMIKTNLLQQSMVEAFNFKTGMLRSAIRGH